MKKLMTIVILLSFYGGIRAQSCGFSCLGLSGIYAGYTIQEYDGTNLNKYILNSINADKLIGAAPAFKRAEGYRFGSNIFRAEFDNYFVSAKGFYQLLKEENDFIQQIDALKRIDKYSLKLNYWGLGVDFGIPIFSFLDLKLVEGGITFFDVKLTHQRSENGNAVSKMEYESAKVDMSYYVGTGIIINIIPNYVSIEGTASYNIFTISQLEDENGKGFPTLDPNESLISGKKFGATVQLNVGIAF